MAKRGKRHGSLIRNNIIEILYFMKQGHGYSIYKVYRELYPKATMRSVYYNLHTGEKLGEFVIKGIESEKGNYSWGAQAEKVYYSLGPNAKPAGELRVKEYFDRVKKAL